MHLPLSLSQLSRRTFLNSLGYGALGSTVLTSCKAGSPAQETPSEDITSIFKNNPYRFKNCELYSHFPRSVRYAGELVADIKHFYTTYGLHSLEFVPILEPPATTVENATNIIQVFIADPLEVALANRQGADLQIFAQVFHTNTYGIMSHKSAPITEPKDLEHKTIFLPPHFRESFMVFARHNRINLAHINIQYHVPYSNTYFDPACQGQLGYETAIEPDSDFFFMPLRNFGLTTMGQTLSISKKVLEKVPDFFTEFMYADIKGWKEALTNPENIARLICFHIKTQEPDFLKSQINEAKRQIPYILSSQSKKHGLFTISEKEKNTLVYQLKKLGITFTHEDHSSLNPNNFINTTILPEFYAEHQELR